MTKDEIMEIALEAGIVPNELVRGRFVYFAELIADAEREACAEIAENWNSNGFPRVGVAAQIRARGQA
jgi:hypothetical protein